MVANIGSLLFGRNVVNKVAIISNSPRPLAMWLVEESRSPSASWITSTAQGEAKHL